MKKSILIADDNTANLYMLKSLLEGEGYEVVAAQNGRDALEEGLAHPPALIVSDILMPVMDGYALCRAWKSDERLNGIPFVFYTATYTEPKDEKFALGLGADRFLLKPQDPETLLGVVCEVLDAGYVAKLPSPKPLGEEMEFFRGHNEILFSKLEKKMLDLEISNQQLKVLEARYRLSFLNVSDVIYTTDAHATIINISPSVERILGYKPQDFIGRSVADAMKLLAPQALEKVMAEIDRVFKGETILATVHDFFAKDGSAKVVEVGKSPIVQEGVVVGMIAVLRDITDRKRVETELRRSEEKYRHLFQNAGEAVFIIQDSKLKLANPATMAICEYDEEEMLSKPFPEFIHPDNRAMVVDYHTRRLRGEDMPQKYAFRVAAKSGAVKWVELHATLVRWEGAPATLNFMSDVTQHKLVEQEQARLREQLAQAQKMESVGRLAGGVAHDFNNMLNVIMGHTELAMMVVDPVQPVHANLREIRNAAERSADLTRHLLAFARKQTIAPKVLDLNETIGGMLKMLQRMIREDIKLAWSPGSDLWPVKIDPSQIDQILANLCVNARDSIAGVGRITIETSNREFDALYCSCHAGFLPGEYTVLSVSDNGCGMDQETLEKIFEPFFTTKDSGKGTGLGLATIYGIVKQNEGFISVYSEVGQGTTFQIYLPRCRSEKVAAGLSEGPSEAPASGRETILVVEDETEIRNIAQYMLESFGYRVLSAGTAGSALRLAGEYDGQIHLLITDVVMPEMNGKDLSLELVGMNPGLKVLFMSGYTANVIVHHGVLDEGVSFIQKPFSMRGLAAKVREVLDAKVSA